MTLNAGDKVIVTRDWCPNGWTTYRKGTKGVVVDAIRGTFGGMSFEFKFDGYDKTVTASYSVAEKVIAKI